MENEITSKVISLAPMSGLQSKEVESIKYLFNPNRSLGYVYFRGLICNLLIFNTL